MFLIRLGHSNLEPFTPLNDAGRLVDVSYFSHWNMLLSMHLTESQFST
jgi:hypothetical protein